MIQKIKNINFKITTLEMEVALSKHFNYTRNMIIPNLSYGICNKGFREYEKDLVILRPSGWAFEVEIKISLADLKKDITKSHSHNSPLMKQLYFAIPSYLDREKCFKLIPKKAGILIITKKFYRKKYYYKIEEIKKPIINKEAKKFTKEQIEKVLKLIYYRVWTMKKKFIKLDEKTKTLKEELKSINKEK